MKKSAFLGTLTAATLQLALLLLAHLTMSKRVAN